MCGILGIVSKNEIEVKEALRMLENLEYRGYDSAGFVTKEGLVKKCVGKVDNLLLDVDGIKSSLFVLHTRWATHGKVNEINTHPHFDCEKNIFIVHNGTIDNFEEIKQELINFGHRFISETDSEIFAHFFEQRLKEGKSIKEICLEIFKRFKGTYAVLVYIRNLNKVIALKNGSPLVIGIDNDRIFLASDVYAFYEKTQRVIILDDYEFVEIEF